MRSLLEQHRRAAGPGGQGPAAAGADVDAETKAGGVPTEPLSPEADRADPGEGGGTGPGDAGPAQSTRPSRFAPGTILAGRPSLGSWVMYGLGSANRNLPSFVVMQDDKEILGGVQNYGSGFLPATFQGTLFRQGDTPQS